MFAAPLSTHTYRVHPIRVAADQDNRHYMYLQGRSNLTEKFSLLSRRRPLLTEVNNRYLPRLKAINNIWRHEIGFTNGMYLSPRDNLVAIFLRFLSNKSIPS